MSGEPSRGTELIESEFSVCEASITEIRQALSTGLVSSVELVARYLNRIAHFDRSSTHLNAVPVLNPSAFDDARASDIRRAHGDVLGPLDGIPFTVKDSYSVAGLPVANGSPAFEKLIAGEDAFTVQKLKEAGAVLLGLTNMPPMAAGGMQRGVYGRAESPYNSGYLTSAFGSGSSNGSGTATAASFAAWGLGEETWSSGRAPASNNSLVAYTPSRGVISVRGNWPLVPTMDVSVPHARCVADLLELLDVLVQDDPVVDGDFWRQQPWIEIPQPSEIRPESFVSIAPRDLAGLKFAVPKMYINGETESRYPITVRDCVMQLWEELRRELVAVGAEVIETDFPAAENYERLTPSSRDSIERGFIPEGYFETEVGDLSAWAMDNFLRRNNDDLIPRLADVDGSMIFPHPTGALKDQYGIRDFDIAYDIADYVARAKDGLPHFTDIPGIAEGLRGLETTRKVDFEDWLAAMGCDAVIFPAAADVGPADADVNPESAEIAWRNGVWVSLGNLIPRHLGIPTVTLPMGLMADIAMPVGVTIAGPAYRDVELLRIAAAIEKLSSRRARPPLTPKLADEAPFTHAQKVAEGNLTVTVFQVSVEQKGEASLVRVTASLDTSEKVDVTVFIAGKRAPATVSDNGIVTVEVSLEEADFTRRHSEWREPYGPLVVVIARTESGAVAGSWGTTPDSPL